MKQTKGLKRLPLRVVSVLLSMVLLFGLLPTTIFAASNHKDEVEVIVENNTYAKKDGAPWDGTLLDEWVSINKDSTMMSCVVAALDGKGYTQTGAESNYISEINGLSEMDGSNTAGWMGTLNDWFTNEGFGAYTVKEGTLSEGDQIRISYSMDWGADLGGDWSGSNKKLKSLKFSKGELSPSFSGSTTEYTLTLPEKVKEITVTPTAANKDYMVKTYLGTKSSGTEYKRTEEIPVKDGDTITVVSGDKSWPSMADNTEDGYTYTIKVVQESEEPDEPENAQAITLKVVPTTAKVTLYKDADAKKPVKASWVKDDGVVGKYHQYTAKLPAGTYYYRGVDGSDDIGGGALTVTDKAASFTLVRTNLYVNNTTDFKEEGCYTITKMRQSGDTADAVAGKPYVSANKLYTPYFLTSGTYQWDFKLKDELLDTYYKGTVSNISVAATLTATKSQTIPVTAYKNMRLTVPKEADTKIYLQTKNYVVSEVTSDFTKIDNEDGTVTYQYKEKTLKSGGYSYRVMKDGYVTAAGYLVDKDNVTVTLEDKDVTSTKSDLAYDDNSILLNIGEKNELELAKKDTFKVRAYRNAWEIVNTTTSNYMIEPDFHYAILSGSDVISIAPCEGVTGNATGNWFNVTAEKNGTAVVAVWYDAINITGSSIQNGRYGATDPARYGIFTVKVGDDKNITWNPISSDGNWDSEFDTVYFVGDSGEFKFKPDGEGLTATVTTVSGSTIKGTQSVTEKDGTFTVPVKEGANIITVTDSKGNTDSMVVHAKKISYTITNNTTGESATNDAPTINKEDSITIALDGIGMPVPKMSGIYNPGYMGTAKNLYVINDDSQVASAGTQYDFSTSAKSQITFKAHEAGTNELKGYISLSSMGSDFGAHRAITDEGAAANLNASEKFGNFGILPDITFEVKDNDEKPNTEDLTKVTSISLYGGLSTFSTAFNFSKINPTLKMTDNVAFWGNLQDTWPLNAKVVTEDYYNTIELKYGYEGEEVHTKKLTSGISTAIPVEDFKLDKTKILNMQVVITPKGSKDAEPVVYNYKVLPGSANLTYVHPIMTSFAATDADGKEIVLLDDYNGYVSDYVLKVGDNEKVNLDAKMLQKYTNATNKNQDRNDKVELVLKKNGTVKETILAAEGNDAPVGAWSYKDLDISEADELDVIVTSYVDSKYTSTYTFKLDPNPCCHTNGTVVDEKSKKEPTCKEDGYTGDIICKDCKEVQSAGERIPATGHPKEDISDWIVDEDPEDEIYTRSYKICTLCADEVEDLLVRELRDPKADGDLYKNGYTDAASVEDKLVAKTISDKLDGNDPDGKQGYDVVLRFSEDNGSTWTEATPETFPKDGVTVTLPYPDDTEQDGYDFYVAHMFEYNDEDQKAGDIEFLEPTLTEDGLKVTVTSLSPMVVSYLEQEPEENPTLKEAYDTTGKKMPKKVKKPDVGSIGGDWAVLGLARSGKDVPEDYYDDYYDKVVDYVKDNANDKEQLHRAKSTENSRLILSLTSIGKDPTDVGGHNLLEGITDMDYLKKQGLNGPVWALIAFDSGNYDIPDAPKGADQVTREGLIDYILSKQDEKGCWPFGDGSSDVDMTAMAMQALAPYYDSDEKVQEAIDKALDYLSDQQNKNGDYGSVEADAQVMVALSTLGIDSDSDKRFTKKGRTLVDAFLDYYIPGEGFKHEKDGEYNQMATEQAFYAMNSYYRMRDGENALYDMTDVDPSEEDPDDDDDKKDDDKKSDDDKKDDDKKDDDDKKADDDKKSDDDKKDDKDQDEQMYDDDTDDQPLGDEDETPDGAGQQGKGVNTADAYGIEPMLWFLALCTSGALYYVMKEEKVEE